VAEGGGSEPPRDVTPNTDPSSTTGGNLAALGGLTLFGWGAFHVVDQLGFHEALNVHNIREGVANTGLHNRGSW
jgi:hypothetical protein